MGETSQSERGDQGLPGEGGQNREDLQPTEPNQEGGRGGDDRSKGEKPGGESREGSQSTGNPDAAG
jgi:hypothetical protein